MPHEKPRKRRAELHHQGDLSQLTPSSVVVRALVYGENEFPDYEDQTNWEPSNSDSPDGCTYKISATAAKVVREAHSSLSGERLSNKSNLDWTLCY